MQIFIKTLTGRKTQFDFELDNTVRHVKEALQEKEGIQVNNNHIFSTFTIQNIILVLNNVVVIVVVRLSRFGLSTRVSR